MDIKDIKNELTNLLAHSDEYFRENTTKLVLKIEEYLKEENNNINSGRATATIDYYKNLHEILVRQFNKIEPISKNMMERMYKAQEILVNLDTVNYYLKWAISKCTGINADHKIALILRTDEEFFREASYRWCQILSSINSEVKMRTTITQVKNGNADG